MKSLDQSARWINQLGQRQGSFATYLNVFHADIHAFLDTKRISADEDVRAKTLSIGVVIPDKFMELAAKGQKGFLFYPKNVFDEYGEHLDEMDLSEMYDKLVENPNIRKKEFDPRVLMKDIGVSLQESGYPYIMFEGNINRVHANNNVSRVKFSNLCSEITQYSRVSTHGDYGQEDNIGYDISCNLGSLNIMNAMKTDDFEKMIATSIDALVKVSELTNITNAPAVRRANEESRSVVLGSMNLHGYLANNGIVYGSKESLEFADAFYSTMRFYALKRSMELAIEKDSTYYGFEGSKYADGTQLKPYFDTDYRPHSEKVSALFENIPVPSPEDWKQLSNDIQQNGLYNSYLLATAPTGSISYLQNATASILPVVDKIEERPQGKSKAYFPAPNLSGKNWFFYQEAYDIDQFKLVDMVATIQQHTDQAISFTYFMKDNVTTADINRLQLYAYSKGVKTMYYMRTKRVNMEGCLSCTL